MTDYQAKVLLLCNLCEIFGLEDLRPWLRMRYSTKAMDEVFDGYGDNHEIS